MHLPPQYRTLLIHIDSGHLARIAVVLFDYDGFQLQCLGKNVKVAPIKFGIFLLYPIKKIL